MKTIVKILVGILIAIAIGIGGFKLMQKIEHDQMVEIVKSEEAQEVFGRTIKNLDSLGLTESGVIKSYEVDFSSIQKNPMGGISVKIIVNDTDSLYIQNILYKDEQNRLRNSSGSPSIELRKRLETQQ
ncbi:DUF1310 family protein [Streptococcus suis]|uniref:DUF1310 domain-containing protein n=3 Tax=Streptococcus suis TaxID=1307 RepID=A0AAW5LWB8_STRSU|nr:DUF1310 family protein [Streptococcus suis]MBL6503308.1 DUF1310 family protein [Streptococcus suis]MBM0242266.1 DUF1310 family protein [Streptococcus suis]MBM7179253.1 DUF1310 family protein [Streptococcus suis]MBM7204040.1 DUF1310 family protein [Streptococcus suis]MBM7281550.1 DUF1310 family protein [Streptococcus suis]